MARRGFETKYRAYSQHWFQGSDEELTDKIIGDLEGLMDDTFIAGSPQECVGQIGHFREFGFNHISLRFFYPEMSQKEMLDHI